MTAVSQATVEWHAIAAQADIANGSLRDPLAPTAALALTASPGAPPPNKAGRTPQKRLSSPSSTADCNTILLRSTRNTRPSPYCVCGPSKCLRMTPARTSVTCSPVMRRLSVREVAKLHWIQHELLERAVRALDCVPDGPTVRAMSLFRFGGHGSRRTLPGPSRAFSKKRLSPTTKGTSI